MSHARRLGRMIWMVLMSSLAGAATLTAQDATVKVYESTFNEFAGRVQPLQATGRYAFGCGFWGCICDSAWTATVTQLSFGITTTQLNLTGRLDAQWCGLNINSNLSTTGDVTYSPTQNGILVRVNPMNIQPCFQVFIWNVCLPVSFNVSSSLSLPPIPLGVGYFQLETAQGTHTVQITPSNVSLLKRNGYVELQTNLAFR